MLPGPRGPRAERQGRPVLKVGFTGSRDGMTGHQRQRLYQALRQWWQAGYSIEFHDGDCVGADDEAHTIAERSCYMVQHPPEDSSRRAFRNADEVRGALPYLQRNHAIVDETERLVAAPRSMREELRSGTWATIRYARSVGKPVFILCPQYEDELEHEAYLNTMSGRG